MDDILELMKKRHSVRSFRSLKIGTAAAEIMKKRIDDLNTEYGVSMRFVTDEPNAFGGLVSRSFGFKNVNSYIAVAAPREKELEAGYAGELALLKAAEIGINSCWVSMTYGKGFVSVEKPDKIFALIALGYGDNNGVPHKSKPIEKLCSCKGRPQWFMRGMEGAMLAPTAMNRQSFFFECDGTDVAAKAGAGIGTALDLGVVVCHFELASGHRATIK